MKKNKRKRFWIAVDRNGDEFLYGALPCRKTINTSRGKTEFGPMWIFAESNGLLRRLPQGRIEWLLGRTLTWEDDPVEITAEQAETLLGTNL